MSKGKPLTGNYIPRHPQKYCGNYPIVYRSSWELKCLKYLDSNPNVIKYSSESIVIPYAKPIKWNKGKVVQTKTARYFPDFFAVIRQGNGKKVEFLIEVKPYKECVPPSRKGNRRTQTLIREEMTYAINQSKWDAARAYCAERGWVWKVLTEYEIFNKKRKPKG